MNGGLAKGSERVHIIVRFRLPMGTALSHYFCALLTKDQYGVVPMDIPKVLKATIRFLWEVDNWRAEISVTSSSPAPGIVAAANPSPSDSTTIAESPLRPANANANSKSKQDRNVRKPM